MEIIRVAIILSMMLLSSVAKAEIGIDVPKGGWRNSGGEKLEFTQKVNYPASSVNVRDDQSQYALIKGKIGNTEKSAVEPYRLIVNGVAMPLQVNGDNFSRPYFFGAGSNNIEIRSPDGKDRVRVQFYEVNETITQPRLSVILSWDTNQTDLDLHVISPDGRHCWYGQRVADNGGALDIDVTTGYGPEIYSTPTPVKGTYLVYVNYYGSGSRDDLTVAQITVISKQNTPDEKMETFSVPMRAPGELTLVHSFTVD